VRGGELEDEHEGEHNGEEKAVSPEVVLHEREEDHDSA
jgi:hypothetical protein